VSYETVVFWSMMLARDIGACEALLHGEAVSPERIDSDWLEFASHFHLVKTDIFAIDLLHRRPELRALLEETTP
jgi:hypothetical protein